MTLIFHIAPESAISPAQSQGWYEPADYAREGFIHCSFLHQVIPTASRHFQGQSGLVVLEIDSADLAEVKVENLSGGTERYPHIYGRLAWEAVRQVHPFGADRRITSAALSVFDTLEPVDLSFMLGRWRGAECPTGHPMDGLLETANWYGKEFVSPDCVHPLLFSNGTGGIYKIAPSAAMMNLALQLPIPRNEAVKPAFGLLSSLLKTEESQARLRMMEHRGQLSATMIYDYLPIHDVFRKWDDDTVLGLMDYKASPQPFFFILRRDR